MKSVPNMNEKLVCLSGLRRRDVSPNEHQLERRPSERARLIRQHYDRLASTVLCGATDRRGPVTAQVYNVTVETAEVERTVTADNVVQTSSADCSDGMDGEHDDGCVDLKAVVKLRKLCLLLKTNVNTASRKLRDTGNEYEKRERDWLDTTLQDLDKDVLQLLDDLDDMAGHWDEVKAATSAYVDHETRYRELRKLNKRAKSRNGGTAVGGDGNVVCAFFQKYLIGPCCDWMMPSKRTRNADCPSRDAPGPVTPKVVVATPTNGMSSVP